MTDRPTELPAGAPPGRPGLRALPVLDVVAPAALAGAARAMAPIEERLREFRTEDRALPRFFVWTLGCQMNRSDSEEMAGRLLEAGCAEAPALEAADLIVINTCAIREAAEQKVIGRMGQLARLKDARPGLRVVLTGCSVREADRPRLRRRYPAVDLFLRPDEEPELVDRLGLASAHAGVGIASAHADVGGEVASPAIGTTTLVGRTVVGAADNLAGARATAVSSGAVRRSSTVSAWLPIVYGCDKTCTYCIVPFSRGPERSRPFDEIVDEARAIATAGRREITLLGQNVNSYGHDLPAEERFTHVTRERAVGRRLDAPARPDLAELLRALDGLRTADGRPAIPRLRFVTSHPWDLSDRLVAAMAECRSVCEHLHLPVQSGDDHVLHRMGRQYTIEHYLERLATIRAAVPGIAVSTDVIVGFCGETEAQFEATLQLLERVRYDQVFAAAFSPRPGTPAARLPDDVPAAEKRRRLNVLLDLQEAIGLERNREQVGRTVEVLVDRVVPPRAHDHDHDDGEADVPEARAAGDRPQVVLARAAGGTNAMRPDDAYGDDAPVHLAGRTRGNRLVHFSGPATLVGEFVDVVVVHAGAYALRGMIDASAAAPDSVVVPGLRDPGRS